MTGNRDNILGVSFANKHSIENNIEVIEWNFPNIDNRETVFDKCCFEVIEEGSVVKGWFESCHFIETNFNGVKVIQAAVVDSKFSKFNKSIEFIEFKGEFFLFDIFYSKSGIYQMFID